MMLTNLHTHTLYCDGNNTPESIVQTAISKGFSSLGFSGHGYTPFDLSFCMSEEDTKKYISSVNALKKQYEDKIEIYLGLEADLLSVFEPEVYDYVIGSCHYVPKANKHFSVDESEEIFINTVKDHFSGDFIKYAESYFSEVLKLSSISPDIIGHFDLLTKFNEGNKYFDENNKKYLELVFDTVDTLIPHCDLFEVNTGAIARGYRTTPYPSVTILKRLLEKNARIIVTSDCHQADNLDFYFDETRELLRHLGFLSTTVLTGGKFIERPL